MKVGIIGLGVVGGVLKRWFENHTSHQIRVYDPGKGLCDPFDGVDAVFISIPVRPSSVGQDQASLEAAVVYAKVYTSNVFIRSTVLPGTNDRLGTIAMPEFLTERTAYEDMERMPVLVGGRNNTFGTHWAIFQILGEVFPGKQITSVTNAEAELAKYAHNCMGALKVTYWNMIHNLCVNLGADYERVREAAMLTGYIERTHTQVPGPDGRFGYGGKCFPENVESLAAFLNKAGFEDEHTLVRAMETLNMIYRGERKIEALA